MIRIATSTLLLVGVVFAAGCQSLDYDHALSPNRGTTRNLGDVSYQRALTASQQVLAAHFPIDHAKSDLDAGQIVCQPQAVTATKDRLLTSSPARQIATLQLRQKTGQIVAQLVVEQQREQSTALGQMGYAQDRNLDFYEGNPGQITPANQEAATTAKQNETWVREKDDHITEGQILGEIARALQGV